MGWKIPNLWVEKVNSKNTLDFLGKKCENNLKGYESIQKMYCYHYI